MAEDVLVRAAGVFEGISQDGHAVESTVVVDGLGQAGDAGREPRAVERDGAEGVAKYAAEDSGLLRRFSVPFGLNATTHVRGVTSVKCHIFSRLGERFIHCVLACTG